MRKKLRDGGYVPLIQYLSGKWCEKVKEVTDMRKWETSLRLKETEQTMIKERDSQI